MDGEDEVTEAGAQSKSDFSDQTIENLDQTHWGRVAGFASPQDSPAWDEAWSYLWRWYRPAMLRYARWLITRYAGGVIHPDEAEDMVQSFLSACVAKGLLAGAAREHGRFRAFVRVLMARHINDERKRRVALKRLPTSGPPTSTSGLEAIVRGDADAVRGADDMLRDEWVDCMAKTAVERVGRRSAANAKLIGAILEHPEADDASLVALTGEDAKRLAVRRFRARTMFAEELWEEVKMTVTDPAEREDERRQLFPFLSPYLDEDGARSFFGEPGAAMLRPAPAEPTEDE